MNAAEPLGSVISDTTKELNDSGCVHDESSPKKVTVENGYVGQAQLLDLSDDVLLYILKYCSPHDLKALGFTCPRLGSLVLERSLWTVVDARDVCTGRTRMRWILQALHSGTRDLLLNGFAKQARGCRGHVNRTREEVDGSNKSSQGQFSGGGDAETSLNSESNLSEEPQASNGGGLEPPYPLFRQHARLHINAHQVPRQSSSPTWPEDCEWDDPEADASQDDCGTDTAGCAGPVFTLSTEMMKQLSATCPKLTTLSLEYCNINCNKIGPSNFPPSVKRLSLRGTRCYNPPLDKSYLFRIHDYLPALEYLDLSECAWLEPAILLPLSKLVNLRVLLMRDCPAMAEFVAYVSLATRYGFRALTILDLRGSPVGDSEVCALGWLPALRELYLSAPRPPRSPSSQPHHHHHYIGDPLPPRHQNEPWELQIPDYYKPRDSSESESPESSMEDVEAQVEVIKQRLHQPTERMSVDIQDSPIDASRLLRPTQSNQRDNEPYNAQKHKINNETQNDDQPGPSKRSKGEEDNDNMNNNNDSCENRAIDNEATTSNDVPNNGNTFNDKNIDDSEETIELLRNKYKKFKFKFYGDERERFRNRNRDDDDDDDRSTESPKPGPSNEVVNDGASTSNDANKEQDTNQPKSCEIDVKFKTYEYKISVNDASDQENRNEINREVVIESVDSPNNEARNADDKIHKYKIDVNDGASSSRYSIRVQVKKDQEDEEPSKKKRKLSQEGPSNEESSSENGDSSKAEESNGEGAANDQESNSDRDEPRNPPQCVWFRRNQDPVLIQCPDELRREQEQAEPRHHVLHVNLGQQLHAVYRLLPNRPFHSTRNRYTPAEHLESSSLVTDSAIRRFGRADGEDVNIVNIGPRGVHFGGRDTSGRPNRSNLRILSATGYRNITNRSLVHLATAAPHLELIDFTNTGVTDAGVESFKTLRPDVEVKYSTFKTDDDDDDEDEE